MILCLSSADPEKFEVDLAEGKAVLHALNTMVFHPQGKQAVVNVFGMEENLKHLLPFIRMSGETIVPGGSHDNRLFLGFHRAPMCCTLGGDEVSMLSHTCPYQPLRKI